jgi:anthranilate/para-aminobenzoate synthase component II
MHGKTSLIRHEGAGVFAGLPRRSTPPATTARRRSRLGARRARGHRPTDDGIVMGVRHRELDVEGVQFHPESILTVAGHDLLRNFLAAARSGSIGRRW